MKLDSNHPSQIIKELANWLADELLFELSIYEYEPQSILDTREIIKVRAADFTQELIENKIDHLAPNKELAFHSILRHNKKKYHIPMIDFQAPENEIRQSINSLEKVIPKNIFNELVFYNSGRSCHAYSLKIISNSEWIDFMGRLLLVSHPHEDQIIDTRWIGHRLMSGFSSLRWSANTDQYLALPKKISMHSTVKNIF
jgi:branched-subunit amino acid transport protein AzlD